MKPLKSQSKTTKSYAFPSKNTKKQASSCALGRKAFPAAANSCAGECHRALERRQPSIVVAAGGAGAASARGSALGHQHALGMTLEAQP